MNPGRLSVSTKYRHTEAQNQKCFLILHGLNVKRGFPSPLHNLPMHVHMLPIGLSTVWGGRE